MIYLNDVKIGHTSKLCEKSTSLFFMIEESEFKKTYDDNNKNLSLNI